MVDTAAVMPAIVTGLSTSLTPSFYKKDYPFYINAQAMLSAKYLIEGLLTYRGGANPIDRNECGTVLTSYKDNFYNNIFLIPRFIDFGPVVSDTPRNFAIWNAFLHPINLNAINVSDGDGLVLTGPSTVPSVYRALQFSEYTLTAQTNGPPVIDAIYDFVFSVRTVQLVATGIRAEVWDFPPDWSSPYNITYEYKTEIIGTRSGKEQRRALRQTPRKVLQFKAQAVGDRLWRLRAILDSWQARGFVAPELTRHVTSPSGLAVDSTLMVVSSTPPWLKPGALAVLRWGDKFGLKVVASVVGDEVNFTSGSATAWPEGTFVYPGLSGRVDTTMSTSHLTSTVATLGVKYSVTPASDDVLSLGTPFALYNGSELFLKRPNWINPVNVDNTAEVESIDYGRGVAAYLALLDFGTRIQQATFLAKDRSESLEVEQFFHRMKGRRGSFYMPTGLPDITPIAMLSALNGNMLVAGEALRGYYGSSSVFKHMFIKFRDGSMMTRPVVGISLQSGNSVIATGSNWPRDIFPEEIESISWLLRWRFATDSLTIGWVTDEVAQFQLSIQSLEDVQ